MEKMHIKLPWFIITGILFSLLSSLRVPFLPEAQVFTLFVSFLFGAKFRAYSLAILVCILCTHHYVIPDVLYRLDSTEYPSIYTRSYGGVKILDLLTIILFLVSLPNIYSLKKIFLSRRAPLILIFLSFVGLLSVPFEQQAFGNYLFVLRSFILTLAIYMLFSKIDIVDIQKLSFLAIFCWVSKMFFSILIPHENPMYREIFGIQWNIYFAGDEYLTLGIFSSTIIYLTHKKYSGVKPIPLNLIWPKVKILLFTALVLALVAQRKGAIPYFAIVFFVFYIEKKFINSSNHLIFNAAILSTNWMTTIFLLAIAPLLPEIYQLLFFENSNLLDASLSSMRYLAATDPIHFTFGLGPAGLYEIKDLLPINDHQTSFGNEVGNTFRYQVWSLPYGRLILNTGVVGFITYNLYMLSLLRARISIYYLYSSIFTIFYFTNFTPPMAFAFGIAFAAIYTTPKKDIAMLSNHVRI